MEFLHDSLHWVVSKCPRWIVKKVAWRYIAGEDRAELLGLIDVLHHRGLLTTVDVLGEDVDSPAAVSEAVGEYMELLEALSSRSQRSQVSLKLSMLGLRLSEDRALDSLLAILSRAEALGLSVCIDMEDSSTTDATLRCYRQARQRHEHVGVAIQACLRRSLADIESLLPLRPTIRVCKGIYREPASIAYHDRDDIRRNYLSIIDRLLDGGGFPALATHDAWLADAALQRLRARSIDRDAYEFQMLLGVGGGLRPRILRAGGRLRLYCPYGTNWYAYSLRRLRENPHMLRYVVGSLLSGADDRRTLRG